MGKGIAHIEWNNNASIFDPDVYPLVIQEPRSNDLMADLLGEEIRELLFFRFVRKALADTSFYIAESGWIGQGGFEIYLENFPMGLDL